MLSGSRACGVCRTDLHIVDGELPDPKLPLVPGHEIVGTWCGGASVDGSRRRARRRALARLDLRRMPLLPRRAGEPVRPRRFTGYDVDGGYAEYAVADARFCFPLPDGYADAEAAPLLCAGLIGYRALRMAGDAERLGLYGFGAAAHIVAQVARLEGREVFAFTRAGDDAGAGRSRASSAPTGPAAPTTRRPEPLDAAIIFAPGRRAGAGGAASASRKGGRWSAPAST